MNLPERFAKLAGIEWHEEISREEYELDGVRGLVLFICSCGKKIHAGEFQRHCLSSNPTFSHPEEVLEALKRILSEEHYIMFINSLRSSNHLFVLEHFIDDYITTPNKMLQEAVEFLEAKCRPEK